MATCACMMIVRNAEETIDDCIRSLLVAGCFQQIIIMVDTRTNDNTVPILQAYRRQCPFIELYFYDWKTENYAAARNAALSKARTEYGYWQDSDEWLVDQKALCMLLANPQGKAYHIFQVSRTPDGGLMTHLHQLRVFPILPGVRWELPVHEQLAFSIRRLGIEEKIRQDISVYHTGYVSSELNGQKHQKYFDIMDKWLRTPEGMSAPGNVKRYVLDQYDSSKRQLEIRR